MSIKYHGLLVAIFLLQPVSTFAEDNWTASQEIMLKSLWLGNLQTKVDKTNSVVNNPLAIQLGHRIFFDKRFSHNGNIACASCHHPEKYFTDGLETAKGVAKTNRNTPTIVGSSHNTWFFHDGRADSLWSQALGPLENELEQAGDRLQFAHIIFNDPELRQRYEKLFGKLPDLTDKKRFPRHAGPVKDKAANKAWQKMQQADREKITVIFVNIGKVLAAYETQLQPGESRFDLYVKALIKKDSLLMQKQLSTEERAGLRIFIDKAKCTICHSGPLFTDKEFHNIGVQPPEGKSHDWGRYNGAQQVLKNKTNCLSRYNDTATVNGSKSCDELKYISLDRHETMGAFKTPSLRNVAKTAPYMHAGQYKTLLDVIKHYNDPPPAKFRQSALFLPVDLNEREFEQLEAFLKSLNSPVRAPAALLRAP